MASKIQRGALIVLLACSVPLTACTKRPPPLRISRILIDAPSEFDGHDRAKSRIRKTVAKNLAQDQSVSAIFARRSDATHSLRIRVVPVAPVNGLPQHNVSVELRPIGVAPGFMATSNAILGDGLEAIVSTGFTKAWRTIGQQRLLHQRGEQAMLEVLQLGPRDLTLYAIDQLGQKRSVAAVKPLLRFLKDNDDPELLLRSIGALVAIGDESAVRPLIDLTHQQTTPFLLQIVFAVSSLGGRTAEGFLVTLASGHPNLAVQRGAKDALTEMRHKSKTTALQAAP